MTHAASAIIQDFDWGHFSGTGPFQTYSLCGRRLPISIAPATSSILLWMRRHIDGMGDSAAMQQARSYPGIRTLLASSACTKSCRQKGKMEKKFHVFESG